MMASPFRTPVYDLVSGQEAPLWERGTVTIASNGSYSGTLSASDGSSDNATGSFLLSSNGIVTNVGDDSFRCAMDADKTVVVCTNTL
jgi:hypothetical protein